MQIFVKDKHFYIQLAAIAVPIALQNLVNFGISMTDTLMLGLLGEVQLSAGAIANQLGFIYMLLSFGTGSGAVVLIAQFWGKGDVPSIHKVITMMYRILIVASLIFTFLSTAFPRQIVSIFATDELVISEATKFLRVIGFSYMFSGIASATVTMLRAVRTVKISIVVYLCSFVVNLFFNWVLIFGHFGAPALGVVGSATATCIARVVELLIVGIYLFCFEKKIGYKFKMLFSRNLNILRNFMENAMPVVINELVWGAGVAVIAIVVGRMGREFTAANAICTVLSQLVMVMMIGLANSAAVIVGNTVGNGKYDLAKEYSNTFIALSVLFGLLAGGLVLLLKGPMLSLYNISDLAKSYASDIMTVYALIAVFASMACTMLIGVLRGGGDTRFVLFMDVVFMWFICIPLGFYTGLYLHWPVWAVYSILKSDEILKVVFTLIRVARGKWINDVTISREDTRQNAG